MAEKQPSNSSLWYEEFNKLKSEDEEYCKKIPSLRPTNEHQLRWREFNTIERATYLAHLRDGIPDEEYAQIMGAIAHGFLSLRSAEFFAKDEEEESQLVGKILSESYWPLYNFLRPEEAKKSKEQWRKHHGQH